jgi:hypothetical protein
MKFRRHALQVRWKAAAKSLRTNSVSLGMVYFHCIWMKACRIPSVKVAFCQAEMRTLQLQNIQLKCHEAAVLTCCWKVLVWIYMTIIIIHVTFHFSKVLFFFFLSLDLREWKNPSFIACVSDFSLCYSSSFLILTTFTNDCLPHYALTRSYVMYIKSFVTVTFMWDIPVVLR